jgi:hypothetical protein
MATMKHAAPASLAAALSVAVPMIPSVEATTTDNCEAVGPTQCPVRQPHQADNRDFEIENPGPQRPVRGFIPTYPRTTGITVTPVNN